MTSTNDYLIAWTKPYGRGGKTVVRAANKMEALDKFNKNRHRHNRNWHAVKLLGETGRY